MRKQTVSLLAILLAASGFFFSCGNTANKNTGALEFDSLQVNETVHLFGDTAKPACNLIVNFTYATGSTDPKLKDSLNTYFMAATLGDSYQLQNPKEGIRHYTEKYISDYRKDLEPMLLKDEEEQDEEASIESWYSYYRNVESRVQFYQKDLLVYRVNYEEYTGGAHGIYMTSYLNMNLRLLRPLHLEDLFVNEYEEALTDLLWNQLMAENRVSSRQELEDMGYASCGDLTPTENFYLSPAGITFYYNVYDIAPYAMGPTEISLPWEMVHYLLSDDTNIMPSVE
ncbi:MAG: DUF3298 domain-containing protein [Bacteroides sp.]|nr:DUF3298 domain-containing protein [Bacteroides sp.]